jgi:hypothetical protein
MRVLPVVGTIAPRLALEKSYSFFIDSPLFWFCVPHGNEADVFATVRVHDDHQAPKGVHADGDESLFPLGGVILNREG